MTWLENVADHPAISATAFRVAFNISRRFNRERFNESECLEAWPSQAEIASQSGITRRGVQKCIEALSGYGLLSVLAGRGRGNRSTCRAVIHEVIHEPEKANAHSPLIEKKGEPSFAFNPEKKANTGTKKANGEAKKGEPPFAHKSLKQISDKISESNSLSSPIEKNLSVDGFDHFWSIFPKKVAKPDGLKAWRAALKAGASPEEIIEGARSYRAEREREPDPAKRYQFTMNPAKFLHQRRWEDDPAPAAAPQTRAIAPRRNPDGLDTYRRVGIDVDLFKVESQ